MSPATILYIAGYGRSGSTVLDLLLGSAPGVTAVGELFMFFRLTETHGCSCGKAVAACPFWSQVRARYAEKVGQEPPDLGIAFRRRIEGQFAGLPGRRPGPELAAEYARRQTALVEALAETSGNRLLVDSSKTAVEVAWRPWALARRCRLPVKVIHLVRDGRAVMWSALRGCNRRLERGDADPQLTWPRLRSVTGWIAAHLAVVWQALRLPRGSVLRVHYEDLARDPARELTRIGEFVGADLTGVIAQLSSKQPIPPGHSISGNRLRHTGVAEIREDDEWRTALPWSARLLYWSLAGPLHWLLGAGR